MLSDLTGELCAVRKSTSGVKLNHMSALISREPGLEKCIFPSKIAMFFPSNDKISLQITKFPGHQVAELPSFSRPGGHSTFVWEGMSGAERQNGGLKS